MESPHGHRIYGDGGTWTRRPSHLHFAHVDPRGRCHNRRVHFISETADLKIVGVAVVYEMPVEAAH
jgi:hypothetical protein